MDVAIGTGTQPARGGGSSQPRAPWVQGDPPRGCPASPSRAAPAGGCQLIEPKVNYWCFLGNSAEAGGCQGHPVVLGGCKHPRRGWGGIQRGWPGHFSPPQGIRRGALGWGGGQRGAGGTLGQGGGAEGIWMGLQRTHRGGETPGSGVGGVSLGGPVRPGTPGCRLGATGSPSNAGTAWPHHHPAAEPGTPPPPCAARPAIAPTSRR